MNLRERTRRGLVQIPNCLGVWEVSHCVVKQDMDENMCFILFYIQSFIPSSLPHHSYTSHPIALWYFQNSTARSKPICIWIIPRLSFMNWCINKIFLPTQAQSLFKFSLVSLVHFPYSDAVWQRMLSALFAALCNLMHHVSPVSDSLTLSFA